MAPSLALVLAGVDFGYPWWEFALWTLAGWLYYALLHSSRWQATPGKRAFGIKVTDLQGARISFGRATWRYFASWISSLILCIGYLMAAWTARKQTLHDKLAGTLVVNAAVAAEDVPRGTGVMPLSTAMKVAIPALLAVQIALSMAMFMFINPHDAEMRRVDALPRIALPSGEKQEELSYAIYTLPFFGGEPRLVKEGTRIYRHSEIYALYGPAQGMPMTLKVLKVAEGYDIQASIHPEARIDGFGLLLARDGGGFSWEWFNRERGEVFRKLQGGGRVQVRFAKAGDNEEIAEILFLDDITMRLNRYWLIPFRKGESDHLVVKRGSIIWLAD